MTHSKPCIILVRPQIAENIGATARAMANFGLNELKLVSPRPYDEPLAMKVACTNGRPILETCQVFTTLQDALKDCVYAVATSRRVRRVKIEPITPRESAVQLTTVPGQQPCALVFGAEQSGLTNEEIYLCDIASTIPTTKDGSLNLGQAVLLYLYEWFLASQGTPKEKNESWLRLATHQEKQRVYDLLQILLIKSDYQPMKRLPEFMRRIKHLFEKRPLNYRENQIYLKLLRFLERLTEKK